LRVRLDSPLFAVLGAPSVLNISLKMFNYFSSLFILSGTNVYYAFGFLPWNLYFYSETLDLEGLQIIRHWLGVSRFVGPGRVAALSPTKRNNFLPHSILSLEML